MEIRCENCGCPNQFGTVFCRNCGKRLKVKDLTAMSKKSSAPQKVFKRIVQVLVTLVVLGVLCGLFLPIGFKEISVYDGEERELQNNIKGFKRAMEKGQNRTFILSPEELVAMIDTMGKEEREVYRNRENKKNSDPEMPEPEGVFGLVVNDDDTLTAIYENDFAAAIPFRMTLTGDPLMKKDTATLDATAAALGHIPVPEAWLSDMQDQFAEYLSARLSPKYFNAVEEVTIKEGKIHVRLKKDESKSGGNIFGNSAGTGGSGQFGNKKYGEKFNKSSSSFDRRK
jgi:hypothetical protein